MKKLIKMLWLNHLDGTMNINKSFINHVYSYLYCTFTSTFTTSALQHPKSIFLNRELNILQKIQQPQLNKWKSLVLKEKQIVFMVKIVKAYHHVFVMSLQNFTVIYKLLVSFRHATFHGVQVLRCSNSSNYILALFKELLRLGLHVQKGTYIK